MSSRTHWSRRRRSDGAPEESDKEHFPGDENRQLRARLRQLEKLYQRLVESAGDILYRADRAGRFTYANPAAVRITGYPQARLVGMHFSELVRPDYWDQMVRIYRQQMEGESEGTYFEVPIVRVDGAEVWLGHNLQILREGDRVVGVQAVARDITENRRVQEALRESEERFRAVAESLGEGIVITDLEDTITYVNSRACEMSGTTAAKLIGRHAGSALFSSEETEVGQGIREPWPPSSPRKYYVRSCRGGNTRCWLQVTAVPFRAPNEAIIGTLSLLQDVSDRVLAEEENRRLAALSRENPNPVLECDHTGDPIRYNAAAAEAVTALELLGIRELLPHDHEDRVTRSLAHQQSEANVEVDIRGRTFVWTYRPYPPANTVHLFATDITSRRGMEERLRYEALHDTLTGLPNRALFMERLRHAMLRSRRSGTFAVLFLDLDRFKFVNDSLGHQAGDELLVIVSKRLQTCLRPPDTVARFGGDEFAILLEDMHDSADATGVAERIQRELSLPIQLEGQEVFTSASIGIALSTTGDEAPECLLRDADMAMYRAKARGPAKLEIFDQTMHAQAVARLKLETDLRRALDRQEFRLLFQPIVRFSDRRICGLEALLRWQHPESGLLLPEDFLPLAEETGVILDIGRWVLRQACEQAVRWRERLEDSGSLGIGVNLSHRELSSPQLLDDIREVLDRTKLPAEALKLEISESTLMSNPEESAERLKRLEEVGVRVFVDDFGTGYTSLSYLHRLPLAALKVDGSLIDRLESDLLTSQLIRTVLGLADGIGVSVVAEGIETRARMDALQDLGCRLGQGKYFSHPVDACTIDRLLEADPPAAGDRPHQPDGRSLESEDTSVPGGQLRPGP